MKGVTLATPGVYPRSIAQAEVLLISASVRAVPNLPIVTFAMVSRTRTGCDAITAFMEVSFRVTLTVVSWLAARLNLDEPTPCRALDFC